MEPLHLTDTSQKETFSCIIFTSKGSGLQALKFTKLLVSDDLLDKYLRKKYHKCTIFVF